MAGRYLENYSTPEVLAAQKRFFGKSSNMSPQPERDLLSSKEEQFVASRDSFYMATVNSDGWPYLQHRGGQTGFLKVLGANTLAFADLKGNRQMISTGNLAGNHRVALFLMDYPSRQRLKIMGHARVEDARDHPDLVDQIADFGDHKFVERLFFVDVISFDWNCPKYITPRYTEEQLREIAEPLNERIAELERRLALKDSPAPVVFH